MHKSFLEIASTKGNKSQDKKRQQIIKLLAAATSSEAGYIMRALQVGVHPNTGTRRAHGNPQCSVFASVQLSSVFLPTIFVIPGSSSRHAEFAVTIEAFMRTRGQLGVR